MPGPYAVRVRTATGWQDIALQGQPGVPLRTVTSLPSPGISGDMVLYALAPATNLTVWFYDGAAWQQVGTGSGGGSRAFSFFMGGDDG